ncbi:MAG: hemolysin family protein [Planctomycetota bacterium]
MEYVPHIWWAAVLVVCTIASVLRRAFNETPDARFHNRFEEWGADEDLDRHEKLRRIGVTLAFLVHTSRVIWIALFLMACTGEPWSWLTHGLLIGGLVLISIVLLETVPNIITSWRGANIAVGSLRWLCHIDTLLAPIVAIVRTIHGVSVRALGRQQDRSDADMIEEGIMAAVEQGEREGVLFEGERSMIESVLAFHDAEVTEVMTPRTEMVAVDAATSIHDVLPLVIECGHSRIPVFRENVDNIVGILYTKDLLRHVTDVEKSQLSIESIVRKIYFVPETKKIRELLAEFRAERFHIAVVLDEYGGTTGLVTIEDILEEIVGEIEDEYDDAATSMIRRINQTTFDLDGRAHVDEVSKAMGTELPESDDYETIAGFIFSSLGKVPTEGESFDFEQLRIQVTAADERKIKRVRVKLLRPQDQGREAVA